MTFELIDTHAHLYLEEFSDDLPAVMLRAEQEGVSRIYLPALKSSYIPAILELERQFPGKCIAMAGIHPCYVQEDYAAELEILRDLLSKRKFSAIGEIGLDYYRDTTFAKEQKTVFEQQMEMAYEYGVPIVIHSRSAMDDTIEMLRLVRGTGITGIFHCFSGSMQNAQDIIDCGLVLGIGGVVTYKNAGVAEIVAELPLENIVLETDAPYLAPAPFRGKRNESGYLKYIVAKIARIKNVSEEEVARVTTENAKRVFM
jgi:TatD DNase family protein